MTGVIYGRSASCGGVSLEEYEGLCRDWFCPTYVHSELPFADVSLPDNSQLSVVDTSFGLEDGPREECTLFGDYHSGELEEAGLCEHFRQYEGNRGRLVVSHLNIRSLLPKHDELQVYLERWKRASVVGMSEFWLDKGVSDAELAVMGMRMYRKDRNRRGGGILVYVLEDVLSVRRWDLEDEAIEAL